MSQFWQSGETAIFLGPQNCAPASAFFVGVGELGPETEFRPKYLPIHSSHGGTMIRSETGFGGEDAFVVTDFKRFNYNAIDVIANYLASAADYAAGGNTGVAGPAAATRGAYGFGSIGTLMQTEGYNSTLFLLNMNMLAAGAPALYPTQPLGYRFPITRCVQFVLPKKELQNSQLIRMAFECDNMLTFSSSPPNSTAQPTFKDGLPNWLLYDQNVAGLPAMN